MNSLSTTSKIIILSFSLIILFTGLRFIWLDYFQEEDFSLVEEGYLDMRSADFSGNQLYLLEGEWGFYPNERIDPASPPALEQTTQVPAAWDVDSQLPEETLFGEGTYYLKLGLPEGLPSDIGMRFNEINSAAVIYSNGELVYKRNDLDHQYGDRGMDYGPIDITIPSPDDGQLDIIIHVTNQALPPRGGIQRDVIIGSQDTMESMAFQSKALQLAAGLILALQAVYAFILLFIQKKSDQRLLLLFGIMISLFATGVFLDDEVLVMLPVALPDYLRILLTIFVITLFVMFLIISKTVQMPREYTLPASIFFCLIALLALIFPMTGYLNFTLFTMMIFPVFVVIMLVYTIRSIRAGNQYGYFILIFLIAYFSNIAWGTLIKLNIVYFPFYPMDFIFSMMALMGLVLKQHADITADNRKQADIIIENEQSKDEFLANMAHELRNPMQSIITINETLLTKLDTMSEAAVRNDLLLTRKIGHQVKFLLDDLRDLTLLKENRTRLAPEATALPSTVETIMDILRFQLENRPVTFKTSFDEHLPPLLADRERLFQVLYNVLHNAVKFTEKGTIEVSANFRKDTEMIHIMISDTGSGISEQDLNRIIKPYEKADESANGGLGLGLNISRALTQLHGGDFTIQSIVDSGTVVHLKWPASDHDIKKPLPLIKEMKMADPVMVTPAASGNSLAHILVAEDDIVNLDLLYKALSDQYSVTKTTSGEEALKKLDSNRFDLVISDVMMPGISGYELTREIRKKYDLITLPVLLLTARHHSDDILAGFQAGANDYVSKPFELSEFKARVNTLTNLRQSAFKQIETEAAWLQSQIRPHFLYNTLNAIASLSHHNQDKMVDLLYEFGEYLKNSFRTPSRDGLITLEEEMKIIRPYLYIEKIRFNDQLDTVIDTREEGEILVPYLAVQTLVENAVNHGALKNRPNGQVMVYARHRNNHSEVIISDNGPGKAKDLKAVLNLPSSKGIGLKNTHSRVKALNGKGLIIQDNPGGGIRIIIESLKKNSH